jgi:hypothetical protein
MWQQNRHADYTVVDDGIAVASPLLEEAAP